jgi:two-component system cell cycle sensor histidine kinase PleC
VRILILSSLLLLAIYTALSVQRLEQGSPAAQSDARAEADILAARAETDVVRLRLGLLSASQRLQRAPDQPLDAAEAALRLVAPAARAVAVVGPDGPVAIAGDGAALWWNAAARQAARDGRPIWFGRPAGSPAGIGYLSVRVETPRGPMHLVGAADFSRLVASAPAGGASVLASADGAVIASSIRGAGATKTLPEAGLSTAAAAAAGRSKSQAKATLPGGAAGRLSVALDADRHLIAAVVKPVAVAAATDGGRLAEDLFALMAPLAIGIVLTLVVVRQARKTEEAQRARAESEQKFRLAVEGARCGIWEWRLRENLVVLSDVTGAMLGWGGAGAVRSEEVIARIAPEHRERVHQALRGAASFGAFDVSFRVPGPQGSSWIDARGQAFEADEDGYAAILGVALDVTEERTAQDRAQAAETRLRDAIESVSEAFVLWDRRGRLLMCNNSYREFFNLEPRLLKPGASHHVVRPVADLAVKTWGPAESATPGVREAELVDGRWVQISERRTAEGGLVITAVDITAAKRQEAYRRANEEELQRAVTRLEESRTELADLAHKYEKEKIRAEDANRAKSEFLANMSHELRTPLNAINGFSEIMVGELYGPVGDPRYKEYAQDILSSGQHLLALINDILDMAKIEAGKLNLRFEQVDLEDAADDAIRLVRTRAENSGLTVTTEIASNLPEVEADYRALKQVLLNLLSNAVKFTPRGGRITLRAALLRGNTPGEDRVLVEVVDTGIGISRDDLARLARPFEQIESQHSKTTQGTGLGLALTKSLIEMHAGRFELTSTGHGAGSVARFAIPVRRPESGAGQGAAAA